jgi:phosphoribosylamine--glycine ligase
MSLDGVKVRLWIENPAMKDVADGLVPKVTDWRPSVKWADLIVMDYNSDELAKIWDQVHKQVPTFGGSSFGNRLESDRAFSRAIMKRCGIPNLKNKSFKTLKEAHAHLKSNPGPWVVKSEGKLVEKHHMVIGEKEDNSDAILQVERLIDQGLVVESVEVEEKKKGVEVGLSRFFNGSDWVGPINVNFEHKRSHDRETGYLTGECGTLMKYSQDPDLPLFKETLGKMAPILRAADYKGQIDLNMVIGRDEHGERFVAPLEFTPRLGYPSWALEDEIHVTPWEKIMMGCATGQRVDVQTHYDWSVGVLLCAFGFPFDDKVAKISKGLVVEGVDEHNVGGHIHPMNLSLNKKGQFVVSSGQGYVLVATGRGPSICDAKEAAYGAMDGIKLPNSFKRFDISDKIQPHELDDLGILPLEECA